MSDTFSYPGDDEVEDPTSYIIQSQRKAALAGIQGLDANPQEAARATELSRATGDSAPLIYGDLENYEAQHKAALTATLLRNNQFLAQYAASDPMAAKISANDWGALDEVSQAAQKFTGESSVLGNAIKQFKEGYGQDEVPALVHQLIGNNAISEGLLKIIQTNPAYYAPNLLNGLIMGATGGVEQMYKNLTGDSVGARKFAGDLLMMQQVALPELAEPHIAGALDQFAKTSATIKPYVDAGIEPPPHVDPLVDQAHAKQAQADVKNLDELVRAAQSSQTKELDPDLFALFVRQHTDARIGIDAEAVRKLYGEATPELDDNKLGFVPDIANQLALAEAHGGDIEVPLADWVAKVDPEVAKELHDFIRVRPGGMTLEEAKEGEKPIELQPKEEPKDGEEAPPPPTVVDAVRQATALSAEPNLGLLKPEPGIIPESATPTDIRIEGEGVADIREGRTFSAKEGMALVDKDEIEKVGIPRALNEFFQDRLVKAVGHVPVVVTDGDSMKMMAPDAAAFYDSESHQIFMNEKYASGAYGHGYAAALLHHEMWHAFTYRAMTEHPELRAVVEQLRAETQQAFRKEGAGREFQFKYELSNVDEFFSGLSTSPEYADRLSKIAASDKLIEALHLDKNLGGRYSLWDAVKDIIRKMVEVMTGKAPPPSILDAIMRLGPVFEEANRRLDERGAAGEAGRPGAKEPTQGELPVEGTTRMSERDLFKGLMPKKQLEKYMKLIQQQQDEDNAFHKAQALKRAEETQTREWKENESNIRSEVRDSISRRPDLAADRFLREGTLYGEKVGRAKLNGKDLTDEQRRGLPPDYVGDRGIDPNDAAGLFGYQSVDQLVGALSRLKQERELEGLTPAAHESQLVNAETERRMRQQYGTLPEQILREAEDHVVSNTQLDILHEQMLALHGKAGGGELPISKAANEAAIKEAFNNQPLQSHSKAKYLAAAGRNGNAMRNAFLDGDYVEAFRQQQAQINSLLLAKEAGKLDKLRSQFDAISKRLSRREPTGIEPEYANFAQEILMRVGGFVRRSVQDLEAQRGLISEHKDLRSFVQSVNDTGGIWNSDPDAMPVGQQMPVAEFLQDEKYRTSPDKMTTSEFRSILDSLKTIEKNGRDVKSYLTSRGKEDLGEIVSGLVDRLKAAVGGKKISGTAEQATSPMRTIGSLLLNPETWFERLDLGNRRGPFSQLITRKIVEGQYTLKTLQREFGKEFREIGDFPDADRKVANPLFRDADRTLLDLRMGNVYAIIQNMGNALQRKKLAQGWGIDDPGKILQWLEGITKPEDWDRAKRMGDFFERIFKKSEVMYSGLTGVTPERIPLGTITVHGRELGEWYHPLIPDPIRRNPALKSGDMMDESGYYRPATAVGYTKKRTGAIYPIELNFNAIPAKINQMLNDIAMRPGITEVSKVLLDKKFKTAFNQYYGKEYGAALEPWLRDAAGQRRYTPAADQALETAANYMRENMSTLLIGWNLGTVMKHFPTALAFSMREVGTKNFLESLSHMLQETDEGVSRWRFAMDSSEELQNRLRNARESISASNQDMMQRWDWNHKFFTARDAIQTLGATPVAMSDFISAVPMWDAAYRKFIKDNPEAEHGDGVYAANTAVRRTHGSTIITNRPAVMRMNAFVNTFMPFYNFFSNALQRNYELAWRAKLSLSGRELPEMTGFEKEQYQRGLSHLPFIMGGLMTYGVMVSLIEQAVDPLPDDKDHPVRYAVSILARGPASMIPGVRDLVNALLTGNDASAGLMGTVYKDVKDSLNPKLYVRDEAKALRRVNTILGVLTGLTYDEIGKIGQYTYNVTHNKEHPRDVWDYYRGIRHGTQIERRQ